MNWPDFPRGKRYRIIYADPAWTYRDKANAGKRGACHKYQTMTLQQIMSLPVHRIADRDCMLFLWITGPMLAEGVHKQVMLAWGFKPKTVGFTWIKTSKNGTPVIGGGKYTRETPSSA